MKHNNREYNSLVKRLEGLGYTVESGGGWKHEPIDLGNDTVTVWTFYAVRVFDRSGIHVANIHGLFGLRVHWLDRDDDDDIPF